MPLSLYKIEVHVDIAYFFHQSTMIFNLPPCDLNRIMKLLHQNILR